MRIKFFIKFCSKVQTFLQKYFFPQNDDSGLFRGWVPLMLEAPSHALYFSTTGQILH